MEPAAQELFLSLRDFDRAHLPARSRLVGVDEAGRGPLAGPVVAAAVILDHDRLEPLCGINDSKQLTAEERTRLYPRIFACAVRVGIAVVSHQEIDRINILRATHEAMKQAVAECGACDDFVLVDGLPVPGLAKDGMNVINGDARSISIAAAGIVAKVTRDRIMVDHHPNFPNYGFADHKGYSTPFHKLALEVWGACPLHRRSYQPVAENLARRRPSKAFGSVWTMLDAACCETDWCECMGGLSRRLRYLDLSESRLLALHGKHLAEGPLALAPRVINGALSPIRDVVGPLMPARAPLFADLEGIVEE